MSRSTDQIRPRLKSAIAILNRVELLHADRDFDYIAEATNLEARNINPSASTARS